MDYKTLFTDDVNLDIGMGLIIPLSKVNKVLFGTNTDFHIIDKITLLNDNIIIEKNKKFFMKLNMFNDYIKLVRNLSEKIPCFPYNYYNLFESENPDYYKLFNILDEYLDYLSSIDDHFSNTIRNIIKHKNILNVELISSFDNFYCLKFDKIGKPLFINIGIENIDKDNFLSYAEDNCDEQFNKLFESHKTSLLMEDPETFLITNLERVTGDLNFASLIVKSYLEKNKFTTSITWICALVEWKDDQSKIQSIDNFKTNYPDLWVDESLENININFEGINKFLLSIEAKHLSNWEFKEQINELYFNITNELIKSFEILYRNK